MASIIILTLAILPMVGMFDMGLQTATRGSNYDKSRALANLKLEEAKSLPFADAENNFPEAGTPYSGSGNYLSGWMADTGEATGTTTMQISSTGSKSNTCSSRPRTPSSGLEDN